MAPHDGNLDTPLADGRVTTHYDPAIVGQFAITPPTTSAGPEYDSLI